jgi:hypothetical protein
MHADVLLKKAKSRQTGCDDTQSKKCAIQHLNSEKSRKTLALLKGSHGEHGELFFVEVLSVEALDRALSLPEVEQGADLRLAESSGADVWVVWAE